MIRTREKSIETSDEGNRAPKTVDFWGTIRYIDVHRGVAQHGLAHLLGVQEAAGSNPVAPIFYFLRPGISCSFFLPTTTVSIQRGSSPSAGICRLNTKSIWLHPSVNERAWHTRSPSTNPSGSARSHTAHTGRTELLRTAFFWASASSFPEGRTLSSRG